MYCRYCGKPLVDDNAPFCGFCGKDQRKISNDAEPVPRVENTPSGQATTSQLVNNDMNTNYNMRTMFFTVISLILEVVIIILAFTGLFDVKVDTYLSNSYDINVFDFFDKSRMISAFGHFGNDSEELVGGFIGLGIIFLIAIGACVIYYIYYLSTYSLSKNDRFTSRFGENYNEYSTVPAGIFAAVSLLGWFIISYNIGDHADISPSVSLVIIYILTVAQFVINKIY